MKFLPIVATASVGQLAKAVTLGADSPQKLLYSDLGGLSQQISFPEAVQVTHPRNNM